MPMRAASANVMMLLYNGPDVMPTAAKAAITATGLVNDWSAIKLEMMRG